MKFIVSDTYESASAEAAKIYCDYLKRNPACVLGLATGSTPLGLYKNLIEAEKRGEISFAAVTTVNLDEYYPIAPTHSQSYRYFMNENLFDHISVNKENTFVPDGEAKDPMAECAAYDARIEELGGIDLQLLGIGENGHIGFNEPGASLIAPTHVETLTESTRKANSRFFASLDEVPTHALTMGMAPILSARKIVLIACGKNKHEVVKFLENREISPAVPASLLKCHPDVTVICDKAAYDGE